MKRLEVLGFGANKAGIRSCHVHKQTIGYPRANNFTSTTEHTVFGAGSRRFTSGCLLCAISIRCKLFGIARAGSLYRDYILLLPLYPSLRIPRFG